MGTGVELGAQRRPVTGLAHATAATAAEVKPRALQHPPGVQAHLVDGPDPAVGDRLLEPPECAWPPAGKPSVGQQEQGGIQSEQEVALGHRHDGQRGTFDHLAVDPYGEGVRLDSIRGSASLLTMSAWYGAGRRRPAPADGRPRAGRQDRPRSAIGATKNTEVDAAAAGDAPHIGRGKTGCGVGIEALASPSPPKR